MNNIMKTLSPILASGMILTALGVMSQTQVSSSEKQKTLKEWQDSKFGLFIHWGVASRAGGDWKGRPTGNIGMMMNEKIPVKEYEEFAAGFNPAKFDADSWVRAAKDAGMNYVVYVAKHHDGFAMYDSKASPFSIVTHTACKHDPLKDLAGACRRHGIKLGIYYSLGRDWHDPDVPTRKGGWRSNTWDFPDEKSKDLEKYLNRKAIPQIRELLTNYGPVEVMWFDTPELVTKQQSGRLMRLVAELQPGCLVNDRVGNKLGDFKTVEQKLSGELLDVPWESCMTMNARSWGYNRHDTAWKTPKALVENLVDIVSKGGNFLLNVGPTGEGEFQPAEVERLRAIGQWMRVNGEAIHGAGRTPFGEEFTGEVKAKKVADELNQAEEIKNIDKSLDAKERSAKGGWGWRCTIKPGKIYIHLIKWPDGKFRLPASAPAIQKAWLLADPARRSLEITAEGGVTAIALPAKAPDALISVLCLETGP